MSDSLNTALELLKSPKIPFVIFIAGAILLFLPDGIIVKTGLDEFRQAFKMYIGGATLLSATLVLTHGSIFLMAFIRTMIWSSKTGHDPHAEIFSI